MGSLIISLDYELMWGVRDHFTKKEYGENVLGSYESLHKTIELFGDFEVKVTIAIVGLLALKNKKDYAKYKPKRVPNYTNNPNLSPYALLDKMENQDFRDNYYFAPSIIKQLAENNSIEIATHTFSHYYCNEKGSSVSTFTNDVESGRLILKELTGREIVSLILPRNQINKDYFEDLSKTGIKVIRGTDNQWYNFYFGKKFKFLMRAFRLIDSYINISGTNTFKSSDILLQNGLIVLPGSRFLRPFKLNILDKLQLYRLKKSMYYAAKSHENFHIWWHPENHGKNINQNLNVLREILTYYKVLNKRFGFTSRLMSDFDS